MIGKSNKEALKDGTSLRSQTARLGTVDPWRDLLTLDERSAGDLVTRKAIDITIDETEETLFALALAVEQRDCNTGGHCERLAYIGVALGATLGLSPPELIALYRAGYLHDVGKVGIPDAILFKPGALDKDEWVTMQSHPIRGEEICRHMKSLTAVLPIIRHHHERWDGSGYPDGLRGEQIPLLARVLQIVDIYDALTSPRPYKSAFSPEKAISIIQEETARGWRDPRIVQAFLRLHEGQASGLTRIVKAADRSVDGMRSSLANLHRFLAAEATSKLPS